MRIVVVNISQLTSLRPCIRIELPDLLYIKHDEMNIFKITSDNLGHYSGCNLDSVAVE